MSFYEILQQTIESEAKSSKINLEEMRQICPSLNDLLNEREVDPEDIDHILNVFNLGFRFIKRDLHPPVIDDEKRYVIATYIDGKTINILTANRASSQTDLWVDVYCPRCMTQINKEKFTSWETWKDAVNEFIAHHAYHP